MLFQTVFCQDRAALTAVDSLKRDKELRTFLTALHEAAISRDTVKLFPLIDENVEVEPMWMDGVYASGKQQFIEFWKLKNKKDSSVLWQILSDVSQMEGSYWGGYYGREGLYSIPSYEQKFEQSAWLVMKDSLPVYSSKSTKSTIVRWLPKGTVVARNCFYQLPLWVKCPNPNSSNPALARNEWIQTTAVYIKGWNMSIAYIKGKWRLSGVSGFEYLYPKQY